MGDPASITKKLNKNDFLSHLSIWTEENLHSRKAEETILEVLDAFLQHFATSAASLCILFYFLHFAASATFGYILFSILPPLLLLGAFLQHFATSETFWCISSAFCYFCKFLVHFFSILLLLRLFALCQLVGSVCVN